MTDREFTDRVRVVDHTLPSGTNVRLAQDMYHPIRDRLEGTGVRG